MPSGTGKTTTGHQVEVVDSGTALRISIEWPRAMTEPELMHSLWIKSRDAETRIEG